MNYAINDKTFFKREKESSKLRMGGESWSINLGLIADKPIERFVYRTEEKEYQITFAEAIAHGFKRLLGGEMKLVVPIKFWKQN